MSANNTSRPPPSVLATVSALRGSPTSTSPASSQSSRTRSLVPSQHLSGVSAEGEITLSSPAPYRATREIAYVRPGAQWTPVVVHVDAPIQSVHGSILQSSAPASVVGDTNLHSPREFEDPRPAPAPASRRNVPHGSNERPDPPRRGLSTSIRQGLRRIGTLSRRPSNDARYQIELVQGTQAPRQGTISLSEAQARRAAERRAFQEANPTAGAEHRYPNALPPRRRPVQDSAAAPAPETPPARARRVKRLSGDSRRITIFGAFMDAGLRSDSSSESDHDPQAQPESNVSGQEAHDRAREGRQRHDRESWQTADILLVKNPPSPIDDDLAEYNSVDAGPVTPPPVEAPRPQAVRRNPVPHRTPNVNKPLPPSPPVPNAPRNTVYFGGIPADAATAFGCDEDGNARTCPTAEDLAEAVEMTRRLIEAERRDDSDDGSPDNQGPVESREQVNAQPPRRHHQRRPSDDGINESIESQIRRYNLDPEAEAAAIKEAHRLKKRLLTRPPPSNRSETSENGDVTIDHMVRDGHVSVLITKQTDAKTIESFRSRMSLNDYADENTDEAAALHARLERERLGAKTSECRGR